MANINRVILIVLDSVGIGAMPDAADFGDRGANTLAHIAQNVDRIHIPFLIQLGIGNIIPIEGIPPIIPCLASYGKMKEASKAKDTMAGHWEMMGLIVEKPFPTFPQGFPPNIIHEFCEIAHVEGVLGNKAASGTEIIRELGEEHLKTRLPIVYTSADSVFQIAAHEEIIPLPQLYEICNHARSICDKHQIGRVIARPFVGKNANDFTRTVNRKDFPILPFGKTALDILKSAGIPVVGIGKIEDIFAGQGITRAIHTKNNQHGMQTLMSELSITRNGLIFVNLVDFDMIYGHRNDVSGYARALADFDFDLVRLYHMMEDEDLLIITADHGCDPTFPGTDHTREYVPLLLYSHFFRSRELGIRETFSDLAVTILNIFGIPHSFQGTDLLKKNTDNSDQ